MATPMLAPISIDQQPVAGVVAEGVVDLLEAVEVHEHHGCARRSSLEGGRHHLVEEGPVGQPGQGVVERLVLLAGGLPAQAVDEVAVLQGGPGVGGHGLEQLEVLGVEGAHVTEAVGDQEGPDHGRLAAKRDDQGVLALGCRHAVEEVLVPGGAGCQDGAAPPDGQQLQADGLVQAGGAGHEPPVRPERADRPLVGDAVLALVQQQDLCPLRPEQVGRLAEHDGQRLLRLVGAPHGTGEAVQELQPGVALAQRGVASETGVGEAEQHEQAPGGDRLMDDHGRRHQGERGVGQAGDGERPEDGGEHLTLDTSLVDRDGGDDGAAAQEAGDQDAGERGTHADQAEQVVPPEEGEVDGRSQGRLEGEVAQVEDELHAQLPAVQHESDGRPQQASRHQLPGRVQQQPEDQGQLGHRDRVDLPPELEVHDQALGDGKADDQGQQRVAAVGRDRRRAGQEVELEERGRPGEAGAESQHATCAGQDHPSDGLHLPPPITPFGRQGGD